MLQFGASLTYDTSSVNYDCNMFIIQATGFMASTASRIAYLGSRKSLGVAVAPAM